VSKWKSLAGRNNAAIILIAVYLEKNGPACMRNMGTSRPRGHPSTAGLKNLYCLPHSLGSVRINQTPVEADEDS
jgi:hypothetical protein